MIEYTLHHVEGLKRTKSLGKRELIGNQPLERVLATRHWTAGADRELYVRLNGHES